MDTNQEMGGSAVPANTFGGRSVGSVSEIRDAFMNNPAALEERYSVEKQLIDLLALQAIKTQQQSIANQMKMDLNQQAMANGQGANIAQQTEQEVVDITSNNIISAADNAGLGGIINERNAEMAVASGGMLRGRGLEHIPSNIQPYSSGGIIAFANGTEDDVIDSSRLGQNNPYNLRDYNQDWDGQVGATQGFVDFDDLSSGVRAADKLLANYPDLKGISTLRELIATFAPPNENDTENYIEFVSETIGIPPDQPIDLDDPNVRDSVLGAMGQMESGFEYDRSMLDGTDRARTSEEIVASDVGGRTESPPDALYLPDVDNLAAGQGPVLSSLASGIADVISEGAGNTAEAVGDVVEPFVDTIGRPLSQGIGVIGEGLEGAGGVLADGTSEILEWLGDLGDRGSFLQRASPEAIAAAESAYIGKNTSDGIEEVVDTPPPPPPSEPTIRGPDWDRFIAGATASGGSSTRSGALRGFAQGTQAYDQLRFGQLAALREIDADLQTALLRYQQAMDTAEFNGIVDQMIEWRNGQEYSDLMDALDGMPDGPAKTALVEQIDVRQAQVMNDAVKAAMGRRTGSGQGVTATAPAEIQSNPFSVSSLLEATTTR